MRVRICTYVYLSVCASAGIHACVYTQLHTSFILIEIQFSLSKYSLVIIVLRRRFSFSKITVQMANNFCNRMCEQEIIDFTSLEPEIQTLINKSIAVREYSYSPYSKFKVGAAILCIDGTIFTGCNVENASYPVGTCAERTAIVKAVSEGKRKFKALAVVADKEKNSFTTPCGFCRQAIVEFGDISIYLADPDTKNVLKTTISKLLPHAFGFGNSDILQ